MSIAFEDSKAFEASGHFVEDKPQATSRNVFSSHVADALLDKLSTDDAFRALFEADPRAALKQVGHVTPEIDVGKRGADPVMCCSVGALADKETIRAGRAKLRTGDLHAVARGIRSFSVLTAAFNR